MVAIQQRLIKVLKEPQPERTGCEGSVVPVITVIIVQKYQEGCSDLGCLTNVIVTKKETGVIYCEIQTLLSSVQPSCHELRLTLLVPVGTLSLVL